MAARRSLLLATAGLSLLVAMDSGWTQEPAASDAAIPRDETLAETGEDADANSLLELGTIQAELDELESAAATYLQGIERLIDDGGEFSPLLIDPYLNLARVYTMDGLYPEAVTVLEHAQHISQRNFGLFNTEQSIILDELSRVYEAAGDTRAAQEIQQQLLTIGHRRYGENELDVIPYHYRLANYYELSRMRTRAREQYETVIEIQEGHLDQYSAEFLRPLRELVRIDILSGDSSSARRRLEEILEVTTDITALERARSIIVLGDWALTRGQLELGLARYRDAYTVLAAEDESEANALFESPGLINFVPPPSPVDLTRRVDTYAWGTITAQFEISANGLARNVEIVEATPPGLMDSRYRRRLLESYFRPRLVGGEPVATQQVHFTHEFRYFPPEE